MGAECSSGQFWFEALRPRPVTSDAGAGGRCLAKGDAAAAFTTAITQVLDGRAQGATSGVAGGDSRRRSVSLLWAPCKVVPWWSRG